MSMFAPQNAPSAEPKLGLHSFKAGRLSRVEGTNRVKPDPRKGLIYLEVVDDLLRFYWKDRKTGILEDDLIIFPDEAEFVKVRESPKGRVFALKFSSSSRIMFYWMQEKESTDDDFNVQRVNDLIADPTTPAPESSTQQSSDVANLRDLGAILDRAGSGGIGNLDLSAAAQNMGLSPELMEILGSDSISSLINSGSVPPAFEAGSVAEQMAVDVSDSGAPSGEAHPTAGQFAISQINDDRPQTSRATTGPNSLHSILSGIQVPGQGQQQEVEREALELQDVLTPEIVLPLLADTEVRQQLFPHLPSALVSDPPTEDEVREIMSSVQWKSALSGLSYALNHGGESAIRSLEIDVTNLQGSSGVEAFVRAVSQALQNEPHDEDRMEE